MTYYFITGTSKGIGKAIAEEALQADNTIIYGISRSRSITHERYYHQPADLSDITALRNNLHKLFPVLEDPEKIVLINNAGVLGEVDYLGSQTTDNFEFVFDVNVIAPAMLMNTFISAYHEQTCPKTIINISSGAGQRPVDGWSAYCASKAALDMLSLTCQKEQDILKSGIKVYSLSPGVVDTHMQAQIRQVSQEQFSELNKFLDLKKNSSLQTPAQVSQKILKLIANPTFQPVVLSVRDL